MPPKKSPKKTGKGKRGGKSKVKTSQQQQQQPEPEPQSQAEVQSSDSEYQPVPDLPEEEDDASSVASQDFQVGREFKENNIIADFFEARAYHYDMTNESYKDDKRKERDLQQLADKLGSPWTSK